MREVITQLEHLRRRVRFSLSLQRGAAVLAWTLGVLIALIAVDFLLRMPSMMRAVLALGGLGVLGYALFTYLGAALTFRPSLTQLALRVESSVPRVAGRLASSVEFAAAGMDQENVLAARSVRDTETRLRGESMGGAITGGRTWRNVLLFAVIAALAGTFIAVNPAVARTGTSRILMPFGDARWPARTGVASMMDDVLPSTRVYPRGQALPLRAAVTKGDDDQRVYAEYRVKVDGRFQPWSRIVLTHQGGGVHERLVDTNAEELEVTFETADDFTDTDDVRLVPPPSIERATLTVTPPSYIGTRVPVLRQELGPGTDGRATTETPAIAGSEAELVLHLNKPLPVPDDTTATWLAATFGWDESRRVDFRVEGDDASTQWVLAWPVDESVVIPVELFDEHGLHNTEPISYRIDALQDGPPVMTILDPPADQPVLATAIVPLAGEATDDVAVGRVGLVARVARADANAGTPPDWEQREDVDAPSATIQADLELSQFSLAQGDVVLVHGEAEDLYEMDTQEHGAVLSAVRRLRVIGELEFAGQLRRQLGAVRQNAIRVESLQAELQEDVIESGPQVGMDRAEAQLGERIAAQGEVLDEIDRQMDMNRLDDAALADLVRQSRDLLDFAGRAVNEAVEQLQERQENPNANRPPAPGQAQGEPGAPSPGKSSPQDPGRPGQAGQPSPGGQPSGQPSPGQDTPQGAQPEAGAEAGEQPEDVDEFDIAPLPEPAAEDRPIVEAQQAVRDELADLIELLDRDEDTWVVTRQLESLLEEQTRLQSQTADLHRRTLGRDREDLSEPERTELDRIAETQRDLRDQARQLIDELRDRAEAMEEVDPESAEGMRAAANTAEQRELDRDMEKASDRAQENQLQNAAAAQQQARETMQRMLEDIDESKRAQVEELLRKLASLVDSIERLVVVQENELTALAAAEHNNTFLGRDRSMIRLNQNTHAVSDEARAAGPETRRIARTLDRAADAQGAAVVALREFPVDAPAARTAEERSLELLKEAHELAKALQQQTEEDQVQQQREELMAAYRAFAEQQVALRENTLELGTVEELNRRQLVEARRQAGDQDAIGNGLDDLRRATDEITQARVFSLVHQRIDMWSRRASERLREGDAGVDVTDDQGSIASAIGRLIDALEESMSPPEEFAGDDAGGGGGEGGPQPLIPPVAELRLMQGIQEDIYDRTRKLDSRTDLDDGQRRQRMRDLGQDQRDLMDIGQELLEQMTNGGQPPTPEIGKPDDATDGEGTGEEIDGDTGDVPEGETP